MDPEALADITNPERTGTRLIVDPSDQQVLTDVRETDCRTAVTRGLKEYLETLYIDWVGGRRSRFSKVFQTWAEPEDTGVYPSATVYAFEPGEYDASRLSPRLTQVTKNVSVREVAEFSQKVVIDVWSTDPKERVALVAMLEDAFDPTDYMTGFALELPHYHGVRALFEKLTMAYEDDAEVAQRRTRRAVFTLQANVPQLVRVKTPPTIKLRLDLGQGDGDQGGIGTDVDVGVGS